MRLGGWILLLLLVPGAAAAEDVTASLRLAEPPRLVGTLEAAAQEGSLELALEPAGVGAVVIRFASAHGYHLGDVGYEGPRGIVAGDERYNDTLDFPEPGTLRVAACDPGCLWTVYPNEGGRAGLAGAYAGPLTPRVQARDGTSRVAAPGVASPVHHQTDAAWATLESGAGSGLAPTGRGALAVYLVGGDLVVTTANGTRVVETGVRHRPAAAGAPALAARQVDTSFLMLVLRDAALEAPAGYPARLAAPALDVSLRGNLSAAHASGWIETASGRHEVHDARILLAGRLDATAQAREGVASGPSLQAGLAGRADEVQVDGVSIRGAPQDATTVGAAAGGAVLLLLALAWVLKAGLVSSYTRIRRDGALRNANRASLLDAVARLPGATAVPLARAAGMGRVVAQYHLRVLQRHGFVAARGRGRLTRFFLAADAPPLALRPAGLEDATRTAVARAVLARAEGATQKEIIAATGRSQRLVSYHLARLEGSGLVAGEAGRPRRFRATAALAEALRAEG